MFLEKLGIAFPY